MAVGKWKSKPDFHFPTATAAMTLGLHFKCLDDLPFGYILKWLDRHTQRRIYFTLPAKRKLSIRSQRCSCSLGQRKLLCVGRNAFTKVEDLGRIGGRPHAPDCHPGQ